MLVVLLKKRIITLELLRLIIKMLKKKTTKNVSIENELKGLVKDLAFFLWTNALFDG